MSERDDNQVVVTDVKMPFMSMVVFMVKLVIASIPAFTMLGIWVAIIVAIFGAIFRPIILEAILGLIRAPPPL